VLGVWVAAQHRLEVVVADRRAASVVLVLVVRERQAVAADGAHLAEPPETEMLGQQEAKRWHSTATQSHGVEHLTLNFQPVFLEPYRESDA